ncbi:MAG: hypothetical protein LW817_05710, partial [Candidatus Caenarcaniphilales bacterium]|nr:hypothetical protein [Candidatus Caenarcaniphilales bacterium]
MNGAKIDIFLDKFSPSTGILEIQGRFEDIFDRIKNMAQNQKLSSGVISQKSLEILELFNASILYDYRLYKEDIQGSIAHSKMLAKQGIISDLEQNQIESGLLKIETEIDKDPQDFAAKNIENEDIHMAIEAKLTELIGE